MRTLVALIPAIAFAALPQLAAAYVLPNGNVVWDLTAGDFDIRIEQVRGLELGTMTLHNRADGGVQHGEMTAAFVYDRDGSLFQYDEFYALAFFGEKTFVEVEMYDHEGTAFDGALIPKGFPGALMTPDPPPLDLFEVAEVEIVVGKVEVELEIEALPEPRVGSLAVLLIGALAARAVARRQGAVYRPARSSPRAHE